MSWVQNGASFPADPKRAAPVHFSSQNNPGKEFERTPPVSGDFLDYDPGREDPNSMPGYRDAEFKIPQIFIFGEGRWFEGFGPHSRFFH